MSLASQSAAGQSCNCMGRQNGQPLCPCMMRNVIERDGRWVRKEQDLGPVVPASVGTLAIKLSAAGLQDKAGKVAG